MKKCISCGEIKSLANFSKDKRTKEGYATECKDCSRKRLNKWRNTEKGYLKSIYYEFGRRKGKKCYFTFDEFCAAFEKHKSIYGMKSAWGPGINNLEKHLPLTMVKKGEGQIGKSGCIKGAKLTGSNLSTDCLNPKGDYTLQNIIFIRTDENARKKNTSYNDCLIQIRLHEERFKNEME